MKILHIIADLNIGGAELMLSRLLRSSTNHKHIVLSLSSLGAIGKKLSLDGFPVYSLGFSSLLLTPFYFFKLLFLLSKLKPDIVQTWMYHADILGGLAARLMGVNKLFWNIRGTKVPNSKNSTTRVIIWLCSKLSGFLPDKIVCCAESALVAHKHLGYCASKMLVIENGFDLKTYSDVKYTKKSYRDSLKILDSDIVIGIVGRYDSLKDYKNFVNATAKVATTNRDVKFVMVGRNINLKNHELRSWIDHTGFAERYYLLGEREDIPGLLSAMDIFCLSSKAEGFPNVVAEAMAAGLPCVVTNVGDAAKIVGNTGIIVPPKNPDALAAGLITLANMDKQSRISLGNSASLVIRKNYSISIIAQKYTQLYET